MPLSELPKTSPFFNVGAHFQQAFILVQISKAEKERFGSSTLLFQEKGDFSSPGNEGWPNYASSTNKYGYSRDYINGFQHAYWTAWSDTAYGIRIGNKIYFVGNVVFSKEIVNEYDSLAISTSRQCFCYNEYAILMHHASRVDQQPV